MTDSLPLAAVALVLALALGAGVTPARAQGRSDRTPRDEASDRARALVAHLATNALSEAEVARLGRALSELGDQARRPLLTALPGLAPREAALALRLLAGHPTDAVRDALVRAAQHRSDDVRRAAAEGLARFPGDARACAALVGLAVLPDERAAEPALATLMTGDFPGCWEPLLEALGHELREDAPRPARVLPLARCLEAVLAREVPGHDADRRLRALLDGLAGLEAPERREQLFAVLTAGRASAALPLLTRVLVDALPPPRDHDEVIATESAPERAESSLLEDAFAPDGALEVLRPWSPRLLAAAAKALGRSGHTPAFEVLLRATADRRAEVRRAALEAALRCAPDEAARSSALRALVEALGAGDRGLRAHAHRLLRRHTNVELPLSASRWLAWLDEREAARALDARAREAGYELTEEYLRDHPEATALAAEVDAP